MDHANVNVTSSQQMSKLIEARTDAIGIPMKDEKPLPTAEGGLSLPGKRRARRWGSLSLPPSSSAGATHPTARSREALVCSPRQSRAYLVIFRTTRATHKRKPRLSDSNRTHGALHAECPSLRSSQVGWPVTRHGQLATYYCLVSRVGLSHTP